MNPNAPKDHDGLANRPQSPAGASGAAGSSSRPIPPIARPSSVPVVANRMVAKPLVSDLTEDELNYHHDENLSRTPVSPARVIAPRSPRVALEPERVPIMHRASRRVRHPLVIAGNAVFTFLILLAIAIGTVLVVGKQRFDAPGQLSESKVVYIPRGLGVREISEVLAREGVIEQPWVFIGGVIVMKARDGLKYGEYHFPKHVSIRDVVDIITEGRVVQHTLTFPEGLTSQQIVSRLLENDLLTGTIKEIPREGELLPETYKVTRGVSRAQILQRMKEASRRVVQDVWARRAPDLPIRSTEDIITLASIVEKETGRADERTRVAAVFINRLKQNMRLQSDPTIIYGLVGGKGSLGRPISKADIEQHTPYNTYVIDGLPPGPIANPGRASIEAVANPARTKELFFVANGSGGHVFSENYEQHLKNVARLRAIERGGSVPALTPAPEAAAAPAPVAGSPAAAPAPSAVEPPAAPTGNGSNRRTSAPRR